MNTTPIIDQEIFNQNLLLTQAYCELQLANTEKYPSEILRSFNPEYDGKPMFSFGIGRHKQFSWNEINWNIDVLSSCIDWYQRLFDEQLNHKSNTFGTFAKESVYAGRILVANIDETLLDGASESASDGLVDGNDCPPIDTWFYIVHVNGWKVLFAWIPEPFLQLAQGAIDVNCIDCLEWYEDWREKPPVNPPAKLQAGAYEHAFPRQQPKMYIPLDTVIPIIILLSVILWFLLGK
ncbi:hypothetical protein [Mucilaginibacter sp.]|uniref:hypothetical protein n=1 Tax=Mucilaginibacter sp. TaxID=1882438 RepID=UPI003266A8B6